MDITKLLKTGFKLTTISSFFFWTVAIAEPQGGVVAAGSANISQQNSQTIINQTSQSAVINWSSFNTASSESVLFNQPNASSIALNKINSGLPTNFNGSLNANGQVWIINPAGVLFGSSSNINVAGLLATTHNISNSDFISGNYNFSSPSNLSASIINNGNITAANSGMVALVAPTVINNGIIQANLGKVYLSSGAAFVLDLYGDQLINFGSNPNLSTSYVSNAGLIKADGGKVYMTAHAASGILDNVVSMSGVIEANAVSVNQKGEIVLHGGENGTTVVSGKIKASQGHVETSGHVLMIEPTAEISAGNWLIDPADLTISTGADANVTSSSPYQPTAASSVLNVTTLQNALASGNVTVQTNNDGFAGSGNITVANAISWSSANSLTLQAFNNIILNAGITNTGGATLNLTANGSITLNGSTTANLTVPTVVMQAGGQILTSNTTSSSAALHITNLTATSVGGAVFANQFNGIGTITATNTGGGTINIVSTGSPVIAGITNTGSNANFVIFGQTGITQSGPISIAGTSSIATTNVTGVVTLTNPSNNFVGAVTLTSGTQSITNGTTLIFGGTFASLTSLTASAGANPIQLQSVTMSPFSSSAPLTFNSPVQVTGNSSLNSGTGAITFNSTLDDGSLRGHSLTLQSSTFPTFFSAPGGITPLGTLNFSEPSITVDATLAAFVADQLSNKGTSIGLTANSTTLTVSSAITQTANPANVTLTLAATTTNTINAPITLITGGSFIASGSSGINLGANISTGLGQTYSNALSLTATPLTLTSSAGSITFSSTINGASDLTISAGTTETFNGVVGGSTPLSSLTVTAPSNITVNTSTITTTGNQLYNNGVVLGPFLSQVFRSTVNGNITFASFIASNGPLTSVTINAAGTANFFGTVGFPGDGMNIIDVTGANGINITLNSSQRFGADSRITMRSPVVVNGSVSFQGIGGSGQLQIMSSLDGPGAFSTSEGGAPSTTTFSGPIGAITPLSSFTVAINGFSNILHINNEFHVSGAVSIATTGSGTTFFDAASPVVDTAGSFYINSNVVYMRNHSISTTGLLNYAVGNATIQLSLASNTTLSSSGGNITLNSFIDSCAAGGPASCSGSLVDLNLSAPSGTVTFFNGPVGSSLPINNLTVTGTAAINVGSIITQLNQIYNNNVTLGVADTLTSNAGSITFGGPVSGVSLVVNAPANIFINGGSVNTSGVQTYNNPIVLGADTTLTSTGSTLNFVSINSDGTPRGLTLTAPGTTTLSGNIGTAVSPAGILRFLTITNAANINTATINTTQAQTYSGAVTLSVANIALSTNAGGSIIFGNTINGASNLTINPGSSGSVSFANTVGATTALTSLTVTGATAVNTTTMRTSGNQTYNGAITQGANTTYTSTSGSNLIKFVSSILGNAVGRTLTVNSGATGNIEFDSTIGSNAVPFTSLTLTGNTTYMAGVGPTVFVSGAEVYNNGLVLNNIPTLSLNGTSVTFSGAVTSVTAATALTIPGNLIVSSTGSLGQGVGAALDALTVTGTTNVANNITTIHNQLYNGLFTVSGTDILTSTSGSIGFNSGLSVSSNNAFDFTLIAALPVSIGGNWSTGNLLRNLTIGSGISATQANISTTAISTTVGQTYWGPVLFQSLATENFTAPTVTFNNTVRSAVTSTAITITGNLAVGPSGSIGIGSPVPVASLLVTGTTLGPNVTTSGNQTYSGALTLNTDETMISTAGSINYNGTVNGDGVSPRSLMATSNAGNITFNNSVGNSVALNNIILSAPSGTVFITTLNGGTITSASLNVTGAAINLGPALTVTTTGNQTYNGPMTLQTFAQNNNTVTMNTTAGGNVVLNGTVADSNPISHGLSITAAGSPTASVTINGNIGVGATLRDVFITVPSTSNIFLNGSIATFSGNDGVVRVALNGPVLVGANVTVSTGSGNILFGSTIDNNNSLGGPFSLTVNTNTIVGYNNGLLTFMAPIGSIAPLLNLTASVSTASGLLIEGSVNVTGAVSFAVDNNSIRLDAATVNSGTGQSYSGALTLGGDATLTNSTSGNISFSSTVDDVFSARLPGLTTINTGGGSTIFGGIVGNVTPIGYIDVTGPVAINTTAITTTGLQIYRGAGTLGASPTLTSQTAGITFNSTLNGAFGLTTSVANGQSVTFNGAVGGTTALTSITTSATGTTNINGGQVRTSSGAQNWNNPVFIGANTTLGGVGTTGSININSTLDSFNSTPRALTLTTTAMTTLTGNIGNTNVLSALTVTNASTINVADIFTTTSQTYSGAVTLGVANINLHTNASGTLTFGNTVNGASNLTLNTVSSGIVNFNGAVGATTALTSLSIPNSPTININTGTSSIRTVDSQTYSGPVVFNSLAAINFIHTNLTAPRAITFNSTVRSAVTSTAITITGNLAVGSSGSIGIGSPVPVASLAVSGTTLGPNVTTSGNQTYSGALTLNTDETMISTAGSITYGSTVDGPFMLTANAFSDLTLTGNVNIASLNATANNVNLSATSITTSGNQLYMVKAGMYVNNTITFNAGTITFDGTSNPSHNTAIYSAVVSQGPPIVSKAITINGNTVFNDMSGNGVAGPTNTPTYYFANDWMFNGTTTFMGPVGEVIDAQQTITFVGAVILGTDTSLGAGQEIWFKNTVQSSGGPFSLLLTASAGVVEFDGKVGSSTSASASNLNNLTVVASETDFTNSGIVDTNGAQYYTGAVKLFTDTVLTSVNAGITFTDTYASRFIATSTIDGGFNLTARAMTTGSVIFDGVVGGIVPLTSLTTNDNGATGSTTVNTTSITTSGVQNYNGQLLLKNPTLVTLNGSTISAVDIANIVTPATSLTINGNFVLTDGMALAIGGFDFVKDLTINGNSTLAGGVSNISTQGSQVFNGSVTIGSDYLFVSRNVAGSSNSNTSNIVFNGILQSNSSGPWSVSLLRVNTPNGKAEFDGLVGVSTTANNNNINQLTVSAPIINVNTSAINTNGSQSYTGPVKLFTDSVLTSVNSGITFNGTVDSDTAVVANARALTLTSPVVTSLSGNIGSINKLKSLTITNASDIQTSAISTTTFQTYGGVVTVDNVGSLNLTGSTITFNSAVDSKTTSTALTITGNLAVGPSGSIGLNYAQPGNVHVASILVTGTTLGPNVTTAGNQNYVGALTLNTNETMTSTGGSITYGSTVNGDGVLARNLTVNAATTVTFTGAVGNINPLGALVVTGGSGININGGMVNTVNNQTYNNLVTMGSNLALSAGTAGCSTTNCVSFTLGTIGVNGITGPSFNLSIFTYDASKGATGDGIAGTVNVNGFTMGGSGGGNISPLVADYSTVGGSSGVGAWNNTVLDPAATGMYCVNGNCISGTRVLNIDASNDSKLYGQVVTRNPATDVSKITITGLATGDSVTSITLVSAGDGASATVLGGPYAISASNASGPGISNHYSSIVYNNTPGQLTVNPAPLNLTSTSQSKSYGQTLSATTTFFTPTGLQNGETVGTVDISSAGLAPTASVAGSPYAITGVSNAAGGTFNPTNYAITYTPAGTITVNPAALTVTSTSQVKTYGTTLPTATTFFTPSGLQNGETIGTVDIVSGGLPGTASVAGSPYAITGVSNATGGTFNANNYAITYVAAGNITVNSAALNITPNTQTKNYGTTLPTSTTFFTPTGLQNGETIGTVDIVSAGLPGTASVAGSPYAITGVSNATGGTFNPNNYTITYTPANNIIVNPAPLTLTSTSQVKTYGTTLPTSTTFFTPSGLQNGETVGTVDIVSGGLAPTANVAGSPYAITGVSNAAGGTFNANNYAITYVAAGTITVNPAPLTLTSTSQVKTYGTTLPTSTTFFTPSGLQNGETIGTVDIVSGGLAPTANVAGSPYAITGVSNAAGGTFNPNNYAISYVPAGTITVNPAPLNITPNTQTKNYGTTLPSSTSAFTPTGLQNGETIGTVDIVSAGLSPTATVAGSPYAITGVSNATGGTFDPNNYAITYTPANNIIVNPAPLNLASDSQVKTYGTTLPSTTTFFTPTGLQNGETVGTVDIVSGGLASTANVAGSPYAITNVSNASGGTFDPTNYAITYTPTGSITVNPAALTVTSDSQVKTYGTTLPSTTTFFTPSGLQNGETIGTVDITSAGLASTANVVGSPYAITGVSNATGGTFDPNNYAISYVPAGSITVNPAPLNITSDPQTKTYGTTLPSTTTFFTPTGLQNGETIGTVDITSAGLSPTAGVAGSPYTIDTVSNAAGGTFDPNNYAITYTPANTITVNPAPLDILPDSIVKNYGDVISPTTTGFTPTGLQNGETVGTIDISSAGLSPTASVLGGPYAIVGSNATGGTFDPSNYTINYLSGADITVNPAALTLTSDPQTKPYGVTLPPATTFFTPVGLQNGETVGTIDIASAGLNGSATEGIYPITSVSNATGGTFDPNNYAITYVAAGDITVTGGPAPVINPINVPPTEEFDPPQGPGCGKAGCDNIWMIIFDPLNGVGIPDDIIVYPVTYAPENPNIVGVVTETDGPTSVAIDGNGNVRELKVGSVIYKEDTVVAAATGCACIETQSHEKKCTHDTKNNPAWTNSCKANYFGKEKLNNTKKSAHKISEKASVVEATLKTLEDHWWHYPVTDQNMFMR